MRLLLGAFEPFGGEPVNPSVAVTQHVQADPPPGICLALVTLPVRYDQAWSCLEASILQARPDAVLLTGLAGGRAGLSIERIAINLDDGRIADNAGERRIDLPVVATAPAAYFTTLPARAMAAAARAAGVEATLSHSAGTFLCNHVLYRLCHHAATASPALRCGFVHLPWLPEQAAAHRGEPSLTLPAMVAGVRAVIDACSERIGVAMTATQPPIRRLAELDQAALLALNNAHATELSWLPPERLAMMLTQAFYAGGIGDVDAALIAFDQDSAYAGRHFAWFRARYERFVYIDRIVVAAGARGRGLARALYNEVFAAAAARGHTLVTAEVNVIPPNPASLAFHARCGFAPISDSVPQDDGKTVRYFSRALPWAPPCA